MNWEQQIKWSTYNETDLQTFHHDRANRIRGEGTGTFVRANGKNSDDGLEGFIFTGWKNA
jgi:hypothetical protein